MKSDILFLKSNDENNHCYSLKDITFNKYKLDFTLAIKRDVFILVYVFGTLLYAAGGALYV